ncbi:MAG: DNA-processing protein DprA [Tissierellia bacterium]|nr:DNA-processing protein DprA [Tissierellia bacterium]
MERRDGLLLLNAVGLFGHQIRALEAEYGDIVQAIERALSGDTDGDLLLDKLGAACSVFDLNSYKEKLRGLGVQATTILDGDYPDLLLEIDDAPMVLYHRGELNSPSYSLAVVGSRKCTSYASWTVDKLVQGLSEYGVTIVSGLALGVDKLAHIAALENGMRTVAVLGNGLDTVYPKSHLSLANRILDCCGAIISEFPLGAPPLPFHFPMRNRIISGLSLGVLVIEAQQKSGTLITAGLAAAQGREVFAVPGNINSLYSQGTNHLIRDGAKLVSRVEDIVEEIPSLMAMKQSAEQIQRDLSDLSDGERRIYELLVEEDRTIDELVALTNVNIGELTGQITLLEMRGLVRAMDNRWFIID